MRISYSSWSLFTFLGMPGGSLGLSVTHLEAQQQAQHQEPRILNHLNLGTCCHSLSQNDNLVTMDKRFKCTKPHLEVGEGWQEKNEHFLSDSSMEKVGKIGLGRA